MIIGLAAALFAALCYGFGSILQSVAATGSTASDRFDVAGLARLIAQWRYVAGLALDLLGFLAALVALRVLPLFVVQAAVASSVGVTAVAAQVLLGVRLASRERRALAALVSGLVLLAVAGRPERAAHLAEPVPVILLVGAAALAVTAALVTRSSTARAGVVLAAAAGIAFGAVGVAARALDVPHRWVHALADPLLYAIAVYGILATLLYAAALQRTPVTTTAAITFSVETVLPAAVGLTVLGDHARAGLAPVAGVGFALTVLASISLARFAEPSSAAASPSG